MAIEWQRSFSAGELAPTLWHRSDLGLYGGGARVLRNFQVTPHGSVTNRTGSQHIALAKSGGVARVVPFVFDGDWLFVLVLSNTKIEAWRAAAADTRHTWEMHSSMVTPFLAADLFNLQFNQIGTDVLITSASYAPYRVRFPVDSVVFGGAYSFAGDTSVFKLVAGLLTEPFVKYNSTLVTGSTTYPLRPWQWVITRVVKYPDGRVTETVGHQIAYGYNGLPAGDETPQDTYERGVALTQLPTYAFDLPETLAVYAEKPAEIWTGWFGVGESNGFSGSAARTLVASRVYRGREGRFGYIGETTGEFFVDEGADPDYSDPPPVQDRSPLDGGNPRAAAYFGSRFFVGGTDDFPNKIAGSKVEEYANFQMVEATQDADDPVEVEIAHTRQVGIRHLVPHQAGLIALTTAEEFLIQGSGQDDPIASNALIRARSLNTNRGSSTLAPVTIGSQVIFMEAKGVKPRELQFSGDGAVARDLSLASRHLFAGFTIVDWAYAEDPFQTLWLVRSDGALLSLCYVPEFQVYAWARHDITGGLVESVACIPEGSEDGVYLIVNRDDDRYLERLAFKLLPPLAVDAVGDDAIPDLRYAIHMDRAVTYNGAQTNAFTLSDPMATGANPGDEIVLTFASGGTGLTGSVIQVDVPIDSDGVPQPPIRVVLGAEAPASTYVATVVGIGAVPAEFLDVSISAWWLCAITVTGLGHLEGQTVVALADGSVVPGLVVNAGAVVLDDYAAIAHVGLSYTSLMESLDAAQDRAKQKVTREVFVELERSRGGEVKQRTRGDWAEIAGRTTDDAYEASLPQRELRRVTVAAGWGPDGAISVRQTEPLPFTLLGIGREYQSGG